MWTNLRKEIEKLRKEFGLTEIQFQPIGPNEWQGIEDKIYDTFCKLTHYKSRPVWLWEHFKLDTFSISREHLYIYLDRLIDNNEVVWFFVNETVNEADKFWFYQGQVKPIQAIIAEAFYLDEIYLVSKKYKWLICINHHDVLIATGQTMTDKLRQLDVLTKST
jgi:hypothetical protein